MLMWTVAVILRLGLSGLPETKLCIVNYVSKVGRGGEGALAGSGGLQLGVPQLL